MLQHHQRAVEIEVEGARHLVGRGVLAGHDQVDVVVADGVDAPALLAHTADALGRVGIGGKVQMGQLGDGVADLLVERARDVAALQMGNGGRRPWRGPARPAFRPSGPGTAPGRGPD